MLSLRTFWWRFIFIVLGDPAGLARAIVLTMRTAGTVSGASTTIDGFSEAIRCLPPFLKDNLIFFSFKNF
jgi:hypothetical protein